ncbi:GNAT family N-acetyltransferase [Microbacterium sp. HJ5]
MSLVHGFDVDLVPADPGRDGATIQRWLADPHGAFWGMASLDAEAVTAYLAGVVTHPHQDGWLGLVDSAPAFYAETYDPAHVLLPGIHDRASGDLGMHVLISPPAGRPRHGLTDAVFAAVMRWCFDGLDAARVIVEPDVRNAAIRRKNVRAGFTEVREVQVVDGGHAKTAALSVCTRDDFALSELGVLAPFTSAIRGARA